MSRYTRTCGIDHLMIDANGTTGNRVSRGVGDYGDPQEGNRGGHRFHAHLREHDLAVVNAVCETDGPVYTCKRNGRLNRIDYIAIPVNSTS